ncbi:MAG: hypothetical protein SFW65_10430 [Alphaproteobacteria bacterium]|nr:hypothetical protein [Alphaproteobacteria bacterium]
MSMLEPDHAALYRDVHLFGEKRGLFSPFYHAHARKKGPRFDQMRAVNTVAFATLAQLLQGKRAIYRFGAISKGMRANYQAKMNGPFMVERSDGSLKRGFDTLDLDEKIGSQQYLAEVIMPNQRTQIEGLSFLRSLFPESPVIVPAFLQAATVLSGQPNFDRGVKRKDKDYMVLWDPVIVELINMLPMQGDWHFSRSSHLELGRAVLIAAGLEPRRPQADMSFPDIDKQEVTLYEMAKKRLEYLVWAVENKFDLDIEPTQLVRDLAIAQMAERGLLPNANPVFMAGIEANIAGLRDLQKEVEPFLLAQIKADKFEIDTVDLHTVNPDFCFAVDAAKGGVLPATSISLSGLSQQFALRRYSDADLQSDIYNSEEIRRMNVQGFALGAGDIFLPPMRQSDTEAKSLKDHDGRSIFSRPIIADLTEREMMQAQFVLGVAETFMLPAKRTLFIVADDKYGPETDKLHEAAQLAYNDEAPNVAGAAFQKKIREPHRSAIRELQQKLSVHGHVISTSDFQRFYGVFQNLPEFAVSPGEAMPGSAARLAARHRYLARNVTDFVFKTGMWEQSNDGVQDMILATRMQLGLESGAEHEPHTIRLVDENGKPLSLADRAMAIWPQLKNAIEAGRDARDLVEPATAIAQLWAFHRLLTDHPLRQMVFTDLRGKEKLFLPANMNWHRLPVQPGAYDQQAFEKLWHDEIKPALEGRLAMAVRTRHLSHIDDFAELKRRQDAAQKIDMAGTRPEAVRTAKSGGVVGVREASRNAM